MASISKTIGAPYCMMITFEIAPEDESEFNDIYDNDHIPTIMKLDGVTEVIRFRDPGPNERGYLVYSAIYFMTPTGVMKMPKTGGAAKLVSLLSPPSPLPTCIAVDDAYVYWVDGSKLMRLEK